MPEEAGLEGAAGRLGAEGREGAEDFTAPVRLKLPEDAGLEGEEVLVWPDFAKEVGDADEVRVVVFGKRLGEADDGREAGAWAPALVWADFGAPFCPRGRSRGWSPEDRGGCPGPGP